MALRGINRTRALAFAVAGLAFVVALAVFSSRDGAGAPPDAAGAGAAVSARTGLPRTTAARVTQLQSVLRQQPRNAQLWAELGQSYYQRVRETGDFGYYGRAQEAFATSRRLDPHNLDATVGLATIALARHDFRRGVAYAQEARRQDPLRNAPYPALVDGLIETGQYATAERTLQRFVDIDPALPSYARVSYFRELSGDLSGAVQAMQFAISAGGGAPENVAYVRTLLGDLEFLQGHLARARRAYALALVNVPRYPLAGAGLAQVDAASGDYRAATRRLREVIATLPLPQFIISLGEIELAAGQPAAARRDFQLIGAEEQLLHANGINTDVDLALYEAGHGDPRRAVKLGRAAWAAAPSVRSADALGWALTRSGDARAGLRWARRALKLGSVDPFFLFHAGVAAARSGDRALARGYLRRAIARNPRFSPLYGPQAAHILHTL